MLKNNKNSKERTKNVKSNIIWSVLLKTVSVGITFILLPLTVHYLDAVQYGIWVTLFSVMSWVNFLDMGIGLGLRNKLAEAVSTDNQENIKEYISTGYAVIGIIGLSLLSLFIVIISFVDFNVIFNTQVISGSELYKAVLFTGIFVIATFVLSIVNQIFYAYQMAAVTGVSQICHNLIMLGLIYCLTLQTDHNLLYFVVSYGFASLFSNVFFTIYFFSRKKDIIPRFSYIRLNKIKGISNLGIKFFVMQIACLLGFSSSNILITQLLGPEYVRSYDVVFKIFSIIPMIHALIVTPLWSAYTDAYIKKDFIWIEKILAKLNCLMIIIAAVAIGIAIFIKPIIKLWIGVDLEYSDTLISLMVIHVVLLTWNNNYAYLLNGVGKVDVQMIGWVIGSLLIVPLSIYFIKTCNMQSEGVLLSIILCLLINSIITPIHTYKILKDLKK